MTTKLPKSFQPLIPTQFYHLRFFDSDANTILNHGGYTLAYRLLHAQEEHRLVVQYAYSECSLHDNFNKSMGRKLSYHRLVNEAPDFFSEFDLDANDLGVNFEQKLVQLNGEADGLPIVDLVGKEFNVIQQLVSEFIEEWSSVLYQEFDDELLLDNLVPYRSGVAIDADVLDMLDTSDLDPDDLIEDMGQMLMIVESASEKLNRPIDLSNQNAVSALLDEMRHDFAKLNEMLVGNGVSLEELTENGDNGDAEASGIAEDDDEPADDEDEEDLDEDETEDDEEGESPQKD